MKYFFVELWEILTEPFDGWLDGVMRILMWLLLLAVLAMILWGLFWLVDSTFREKKEGVGVVSGASFSPAHITTTFMHVGKSMVPISHFHPDSWSIFITVDGIGEDDIQVTHEYYNWATNGTKVNIRYKTGRISGGLYITDLLP